MFSLTYFAVSVSVTDIHPRGYACSTVQSLIHERVDEKCEFGHIYLDVYVSVVLGCLLFRCEIHSYEKFTMQFVYLFLCRCPLNVNVFVDVLVSMSVVNHSFLRWGTMN